MKKDQVIHVKIDQATYSTFKAFITKNDLKMSGFIRNLIKEKLGIA